MVLLYFLNSHSIKRWENAYTVVRFGTRGKQSGNGTSDFFICVVFIRSVFCEVTQYLVYISKMFYVAELFFSPHYFNFLNDSWQLMARFTWAVMGSVLWGNASALRPWWLADISQTTWATHSAPSVSTWPCTPILTWRRLGFVINSQSYATWTYLEKNVWDHMKLSIPAKIKE